MLAARPLVVVSWPGPVARLLAPLRTHPPPLPPPGGRLARHTSCAPTCARPSHLTVVPGDAAHLLHSCAHCVRGARALFCNNCDLNYHCQHQFIRQLARATLVLRAICVQLCARVTTRARAQPPPACARFEPARLHPARLSGYARYF